MRLTALFLVPLIVVQTASPHGGRTDSSGGHYNRSTGEYHFHNKGYVSREVAPSFGTSESRPSNKHGEKYYQLKYAKKLGGRLEIRMPDGTFCDIVTTAIAYEVDFADNWADALGQCLNYANQTGKRPGIILLLENRGDKKHLERLKTLSALHSLNIKIVPHYIYDDIAQ